MVMLSSDSPLLVRQFQAGGEKKSLFVAPAQNSRVYKPGLTPTFSDENLILEFYSHLTPVTFSLVSEHVGMLGKDLLSLGDPNLTHSSPEVGS